MITSQIWLAGNECIGIVQIVQDHERDTYRQTGQADFKYYIGVGSGQNEREDAQYIAEHCLPFDKSAGDALFRIS